MAQNNAGIVRSILAFFELHAGRVAGLVVYFQRERALAELGVGPQRVAPAC